jgi:hypothetical protein
MVQRLAVTEDEIYALYGDRYNRQYRLTLAPHVPHAAAHMEKWRI